MNETLNELVAQKQEMEEIVKSLINLDLVQKIVKRN